MKKLIFTALVIGLISLPAMAITGQSGNSQATDVSTTDVMGGGTPGMNEGISSREARERRLKGHRQEQELGNREQRLEEEQKQNSADKRSSTTVSEEGELDRVDE